MALYFSSNQFDELSDYDFRERQEIIAIASTQLTPVQKVSLNICKLAVLIPPFFMLAKVDSWMFLLPLVFVLVGYFIVLRPLSLMFIKKHLAKAIEKFEKRKDNS